MGRGDFARNIQTQTEATRRVVFALMVRPPHQGIEDARRHHTVDGSSAVADIDTSGRPLPLPSIFRVDNMSSLEDAFPF
jgi:hypothetical protein